MLPPSRGLTALLALALLLPAPSSAQIGRVIDRAKDRAERNVENRVNREADKLIDGAIACALGDTQCVEDAQKDGKPVVITDADGEVIRDPNGTPITDQDAAAAAGERPGEGVWRNYDFVPGDSVWYASDWERERVGRIPAAQIEFVSGNLEIVELAGKKLLESKSPSVFRVALPATLPEQFTLEFMLKIGAANMMTHVYIGSKEVATSRYEHDYLNLYSTSGIAQRGQFRSQAMSRELSQGLTPIKLQVDGEYAILYVGSIRVAQVPNASFASASFVEFSTTANANYPTYISDIVVSVGLDPLYDGLMRTGEVTTYGFLFDVDSDRLRPESTPKLMELLEMMEDHADLKLGIEGHTDATGDEDHNQDLSERRAQSVVDWLTGQGIAGNRLSASGMGEGEPIGDNATPSGRQQNRRVVLKRM